MDRSVNTPAIRVEGLEKTFKSGESEVTAVDGVSFEIETGQVVGLLGPNGAGKTTVIKSMLGLIIPDAGTVEIAGIDVHAQPNLAHNHVGAILEGARNIYWRLTVRENLQYFAGLGGDDPAALRDRHNMLLDQFGLADRENTTVNELSRGMKQKTALASTLARGVDVVFMDEPTLGLDVETSIELRAELRELADQEDVVIILCSHDMDVIEEVCDSVIVLSDGRTIKHDTIDALLGLFKTQQYEIIVDERLSGDPRSQLDRLSGVECDDRGEQLVISIRAADSAKVYAVMTALARSEPEIKTMQTVEPNLEEAFLRLTETDIGATQDGESGADPDQSGKASETSVSTQSASVDKITVSSDDDW